MAGSLLERLADFNLSAKLATSALPATGGSLANDHRHSEE
jgi:hypothetical protein